jgi:SPP1 gp7 family putative phage head morphogenesis protein
MQFVKNNAQSLAEDQVTSMKINAILTASNGPVKGYSIAQTMVNVEKIIEDFIEGNKVAVGASLATVVSLNFGEQQFFKEIKEQLWGYRFVAIDDDKTSEICLWYDGKTFSVDSPELSIATPPLHQNCRSHLEPIYKAETEDKPKIDDDVAPPSIQQGKTVY